MLTLHEKSTCCAVPGTAKSPGILLFVNLKIEDSLCRLGGIDEVSRNSRSVLPVVRPLPTLVLLR